MPRYLIERTYTVDMNTLPEVATRSKAIGHHRFPEIVWEHSHVVIDSAGTPRSYCVYDAPSEEMVREHSALLGDHFDVQSWIEDRLRLRRAAMNRVFDGRTSFRAAWTYFTARR